MIVAKRVVCALLLAIASGRAGAQISLPAGTALNLGGGTLDAACEDVNVGGTLAIAAGKLIHARNVAVPAGGTLDGGSGTIGLSGNFTQSGMFASGTGNVAIADGCGATTSTLAGASSFYVFTASTTAGHGIVFPANVTESVAHALNLAGASGALLTIRSNSAGMAGNLALAGVAAQIVAYVDVADNHATVQPIGSGTAASFHSIKGSNSNGWFMPATSGPTGLLNDTGLALCVGTNALVACAAANTGDTAQYPRQDGRFGRDAAATAGVLTKTGGGAAGFDFTPLDAAGNPIPLTGNPPVPSAPPACVLDNTTNLVWEIKTTGGGLRDETYYYTWFDGRTGSPDTGPGVLSDLCFDKARCDTFKFAADVNAAGLCGRSSGWRLPTRRELFGIVSYGAYTPTIDANYFPNTSTDARYWTSDIYAQFPVHRWTVDFLDAVTSDADTANSLRVRLVHDGP